MYVMEMLFEMMYCRSQYRYINQNGLLMVGMYMWGIKGNKEILGKVSTMMVLKISLLMMRVVSFYFYFNFRLFIYI